MLDYSSLSLIVCVEDELNFLPKWRKNTVGKAVIQMDETSQRKVVAACWTESEFHNTTPLRSDLSNSTHVKVCKTAEW